MRRRHGIRSAQRGVALIVMMTIIALGASWMMVSALNAASNRTAPNRNDNARVLAEAKYGLVGWMMTQALEEGERNPGRIPCPEAAGYIGTANEGIAAGNCSLPAVGRLPWRTLGLPKLLDAAGEPLWYVVGPGWALPTVTSTLTINSDTLGQIALDGAAGTAVALVIAPGPAIEVQAAAGCTARTQVRNALAPDYRDYVDCENATSPADASFVTRGPSTSFNDQVLAVTTRDLLPGLEGAIAKRIEREIAPLLRGLYTGSEWGLSWSTPVFPFAAPFPTTAFQGTYGVTQGTLPMSYYAATCGADPACSSSFVSWATPVVSKTGGTGTVDPPSACAYYSADWYYCWGWYYGQASIRLTDSMANVANALRSFNEAAIPGVNGYLYYHDGIAWSSPLPYTAARGFSSGDGSFRFRVEGALPDTGGPWWRYWFYTWRPTFLNHPLLSASGRALGFSAGAPAGIKSGHTVTGLSSGASGQVVVMKRSGDWATGNAAGVLLFSSVTGTFSNGEALQVSGSTRATATGADVDIGWFVRNEWHRSVFYAVAPGQTVASATCIGPVANCLTLVTGPLPNNNKPALLLLAGRSLTAATRPNGNINDYIDSNENRNGDTNFEQLTVGGNANDRLIIVNP